MKRLLEHMKNALVPTIQAEAACAPQDRTDWRCNSGQHQYRNCELQPTCVWLCGPWTNQGTC